MTKRAKLEIFCRPLHTGVWQVISGDKDSRWRLLRVTEGKRPYLTISPSGDTQSHETTGAARQFLRARLEGQS